MPSIDRLKNTSLGLAICLALALAFATAFLQSSPVKADEPGQETEKFCLSCHANPDLKMTLPSGEEVPLTVSEETLQNSVHHAAGVECQACHTNITDYPHPPINFKDRREMSLAYYQACQKCHQVNYDKAQDSIHGQQLAAGNPQAPLCTDCHGVHDIQPPDQPRAKISTTCGQCHTQINQEYSASIHGAALIGEDNPDVPVCTDCHGVHNIQDPRTAQFRIHTPDLCASCHADREKMAKYNISADVYDLYSLSWHGVDVNVYQANWQTTWHTSAVCTDCHGTHNIRQTADPASTVNPTNLLGTCQKCHPGVGPNWTGAWIGHNRIDQQRTPFLYYTEQFYGSFTPIVLLVSAIYVILQIIRSTVDRVRRSLP